jgi:hypothetical protein
MSLSNYATSAILNSLFGKTSAFGAFGSRPTLYIGLSTTPPNESGGNITEPATAAGYARVATTQADWNTATIEATTRSVVTNAEDLTFPAVSAGENWGTVTHFFISDIATRNEGNMIGAGELSPSKAPTAGDTPRFNAGEFRVELD